jgi:TPR repeat protein
MEIQFSNSPAKNTITVHLARPLSLEVATVLQDLIRRATEDDTEAMGELGATFKYESPDAAIVPLQRAADLGNPKGMYEFGLMSNETGKREKASEWWTTAARLGNTKAMVPCSSDIYLGTAVITKKLRSGGAQAAGMGNPRAMLALGDLMSRQSLQAGWRWYEEAANLGDAKAMGEPTRLLGTAILERQVDGSISSLRRRKSPRSCTRSPNVFSRRNLLVDPTLVAGA